MVSQYETTSDANKFWEHSDAYYMWEYWNLHHFLSLTLTKPEVYAQLFADGKAGGPSATCVDHLASECLGLDWLRGNADLEIEEYRTWIFTLEFDTQPFTLHPDWMLSIEG